MHHPVESRIDEVFKKHGPDGYTTAKAILEYYRSDSVKSFVQQCLRDKLEALLLEGDKDSEFSIVGDYLNQWKILYAKLEDAGEQWADH